MLWKDLLGRSQGGIIRPEILNLGAPAMDLIVKVKEIKGSCPVYKAGDTFLIKDGYKLVAKDAVCMHGLSAIMPFYNALRFCEPGQLGLAGTQDAGRAYVQCPDAACLTGGGTVIFQISKASAGN